MGLIFMGHILKTFKGLFMKLLLLIFVLCFAQISCARNNSGMIFHRPPIASVPPTVVSISPTSGTTSGGTSVTITGTGIKAGATATIGGVTCTSPSVSPTTSMTCTTGAHAAGTVSAKVTNLDLLFGTGGSFTYVSPIPTNVVCNFSYGLCVANRPVANATPVGSSYVHYFDFLGCSGPNSFVVARKYNCPGAFISTNMFVTPGGETGCGQSITIHFTSNQSQYDSGCTLTAP